MPNTRFPSGLEPYPSRASTSDTKSSFIVVGNVGCGTSWGANAFNWLTTKKDRPRPDGAAVCSGLQKQAIRRYEPARDLHAAGEPVAQLLLPTAREPDWRIAAFE